MRLITLFLILIQGCLVGCQVHLTPATTMYGDAARSPKLIVKKTWSGMYAEAGGNFAGDVDLTYDPTTKAVTLKGKVSSDVSGPLSQYPAWIGSMDPTRLADIASIVDRQKAYSSGFAEGVRAFGEAGSSLASAFVPVFSGLGGGSKQSSPIETFLSVWNSFPESERSALLAKLIPTVTGPTP